MYGQSGFRGMPPVVKNLLIINVIFYLATYVIFPRLELIRWLSLFYPESPLFHPYQFLTYMFMHGGFTHILFNMLGLWMFGTEIESYWGPKKFLTYYIICGLGAAIFHTAITYVQIHFGGAPLEEFFASPMLGASGAVYGILIAYAMMFPDRKLLMLFFPVPIKAKYMVIIWVAIEFFSGIGGSDNVAHFAHLGGMLTGFILISIWKIQGKFYS
jgi:membrane associated rhomboid family serine protease